MLAEHGRADLAHRLVAQTEYPSWGYSIAQGATTIWERWDAWTTADGAHDPTMNSYNHYSLGSVAQWLATGIAGLDQHPDSAGWERLLVRPLPGGRIRGAQAWYRTPRGRAEVEWRWAAERFELQLLVPPGARATVHLPAGGIEVESGRHRFLGALRLPEPHLAS